MGAPNELRHHLSAHLKKIYISRNDLFARLLIFTLLVNFFWLAIILTVNLHSIANGIGSQIFQRIYLKVDLNKFRLVYFRTLTQITLLLFGAFRSLPQEVTDICRSTTSSVHIL